MTHFDVLRMIVSKIAVAENLPSHADGGYGVFHHRIQGIIERIHGSACLWVETHSACVFDPVIFRCVDR